MARDKLLFLLTILLFLSLANASENGKVTVVKSEPDCAASLRDAAANGGIKTLENGGVLVTGKGIGAMLNFFNEQRVATEASAIIDPQTQFGINRIFNFSGAWEHPTLTSQLTGVAEFSRADHALVANIATVLGNTEYDPTSEEGFLQGVQAKNRTKEALDNDQDLLNITSHLRQHSINLDLGEQGTTPHRDAPLAEMRKEFIESLTGQMIVGYNEQVHATNHESLNCFAGKVIKIFKSAGSQIDSYYAEILTASGKIMSVALTQDGSSVYVAKKDAHTVKFSDAIEAYAKEHSSKFVAAIKGSPLMGGTQNRNLAEKMQDPALLAKSAVTFRMAFKDSSMKGSYAYPGPKYAPPGKAAQRLSYIAITNYDLPLLKNGDVVWGLRPDGSPEPFVVGQDKIPAAMLSPSSNPHLQEADPSDYTGLSYVRSSGQ